jgi:hypothetical protein
MTTESGPPELPEPAVDCDQAGVAGPQRGDAVPHRGRYAVLSDLWAGKFPESEALAKAAAEHYAQQLRMDIEKSEAQVRRFDSERLRARPDWPVWNVLSWIAFRDLALLCEIKDEGELRRVTWYGHRSLKTSAPEALLISALARGQLRGVRGGEKLKAYYWYGKWKVDRDIWFDRDIVLQIWRDDPWSLAQMMIWIITRDPQQVEDARAYGPDGAWAALVIEQRPQNQVENAASELHQCCREGTIQTFDGRSPIKSEVWEDLQVGFSEGAPFVRWRARLSEPFPDIRFSPTDALRNFLPDDKPDEAQEPAISAASLALPRQRRARIADWFNRRQERTALEKRVWFRLTEIADEFARKKGSFTVDDKERDLSLEALRRSIVAREFSDEHNQSRVLNMHPLGLADVYFDPSSASAPELFNAIVRHLWIRHRDCVDWFKRQGLELPYRLRREPLSTSRPEDACASIEPPVPPKGSELAVKSDEGEEPNIPKIAMTFVRDGIAPNVREHTTLVMSVLKKEWPGNHPKREQVSGLLTIEFKNQRRSRGRRNRPR